MLLEEAGLRNSICFRKMAAGAPAPLAAACCSCQVSSKPTCTKGLGNNSVYWLTQSAMTS